MILIPFILVLLLAGAPAAAAPAISLQPSALNFNTVGTDSQTLSITSAGDALAFSLETADPWLDVSPRSGTTPATVRVTVNAVGLRTGASSGRIVVRAPQASNTRLEVPVTLTVPGTTVILSPMSLSFSAAPGGPAPPAQELRVQSSGVALDFTATAAGGSWLGVAPSRGTTPASLAVTANPSGLAAGEYSGTITIAAAGAANSPQTTSVRLTVAAPPAVSLVILQSGLTFNYQVNSSLPAPQDVVVATTSGQLEYRITVAMAQPPGGRWLSASLAGGTAPGIFKVSVNPSGLPIGSYEGTVTIAAQGGSSSSLPVKLVVSDPIPSNLASDVEYLSYSYAFAAGAETRQVSLMNPSFNPLRFAVEAATETGSGWLRVSTPLGDVSATTPVTLLVTADPGGMDSGTYSGSVRIRSVYTDQTVTVPVTMTVSRNTRRLQLSQTGLAFIAVAGSGGDDAPQDFGVLNTGQGAMPWTATVRLPEGAPRWLDVSKPGGTSVAGGEIPMLRVTARAAGLAPGEYQGEIVVAGEGADNSPSPVKVVLQVRPPGSDPGPSLVPSGLIFTATAGGPAPSEQPVLVVNRGGLVVTASSSSLTLDGRPWLSHSPASLRFAGSSVAGGVLNVRVNTAGMAAGIYEGRVMVSFPGGVNRVLNVLLVVAAGAGRTAARAAEADCTATKYVPLFTSLEDQFVLRAGMPASAQTLIVDNCGNPVTAASVGATFTNRDRSLSFTPLKDGRWSATWLPANRAAAGVTVNVTAADPLQQVADGAVPLVGFVRDVAAGPMIDRARAVADAASLQPGRPLAPGSLVVIRGERLAGPAVTVTAGEYALAVKSAAEDRIEAVVPNEIPVNASYQLTVRSGGMLSLPEEIVVAEAAPAVFPGGIYLLPDGGNPAAVGPKTPVKEGDRILLVCTGLGASGASVKVTIGGVAAAEVSAEAQLDQPGRYLVWAAVPAGVQAGDAVPVRLTVAGQSSPLVTIAVR